MDLAVLGELAGSVGFPIGFALILCWFIYHIYQDSIKREDTLMSEVKETRKVNAKALETIAEYAKELGVIRNDISEIKNDITIIMTKQEANE